MNPGAHQDHKVDTSYATEASNNDDHLLLVDPKTLPLHVFVAKKKLLGRNFHAHFRQHPQLTNLPVTHHPSTLAAAVIALRQREGGHGAALEAMVKETNRYIADYIHDDTFKYVEQMWQQTPQAIAHKAFKAQHLGQPIREPIRRMKLLTAEQEMEMFGNPLILDDQHRTLEQLLMRTRDSSNMTEEQFTNEVAKHPAFVKMMEAEPEIFPHAVVYFLRGQGVKRNALTELRKVLTHYLISFRGDGVGNKAAIEKAFVANQSYIDNKKYREKMRNHPIPEVQQHYLDTVKKGKAAYYARQKKHKKADQARRAAGTAGETSAVDGQATYSSSTASEPWGTHDDQGYPLSPDLLQALAAFSPDPDQANIDFSQYYEGNPQEGGDASDPAWQYYPDAHLDAGSQDAHPVSSEFAQPTSSSIHYPGYVDTHSAASADYYAPAVPKHEYVDPYEWDFGTDGQSSGGFSSFPQDDTLGSQQGLPLHLTSQHHQAEMPNSSPYGHYGGYITQPPEWHTQANFHSTDYGSSGGFHVNPPPPPH